MKKHLLPLITLGCFLLSINNAAAQNLPSENDKTFEVMVSPFSSSPISFEQFRFRTFQSSDKAYRLRGDINYDSSRQSENQSDSEFEFTIAPGIEWHAFRYDRISLYYGGELMLNYETNRTQVSEDRTDKEGSFGVGLNAIAGLDVHFLQRLYTGMEVGYGLQMRSFLDSEIAGNTVENDRREISLGTFYLPRFRFGVTF
ncbi:MAG: hypothetical protein WED82_09035 [Balneolales bacterium]